MERSFFCFPAATSIAATSILVLSGCSEMVVVNEPSAGKVELVSDKPASVIGKYLVRFDVGSDQYAIVKAGGEDALLKDWNVTAPTGIRILGQDATVKRTSHIEETGNKRITSEVYELQTTLTISATPEAASRRTRGELIVRFPAVIPMAKLLGASKPSQVPEVRIQAIHYPRNSARGFGRIVPDIGLAALCAVGMVAGAWMAGKNMSIGVVAIAGLAGTVYFLLLTLRDLWWITTALWGQ